MDESAILQFIGDRMRIYGHKTVTELFPVQKNSDINATMHIIYDHAEDRLSLRWIDCVEPVTVSEYSRRFGSVAPNIVYRWATKLKGIMVYNAATGATTVRPYELDAREVSADILLGAESPRPRDFTRGHDCTFPSKCCRDSEVYCVVGNDGVQLWFFNPDFVPDLPNAEPFLGIESEWMSSVPFGQDDCKSLMLARDRSLEVGQGIMLEKTVK